MKKIDKWTNIMLGAVGAMVVAEIVIVSQGAYLQGLLGFCGAMAITALLGYKLDECHNEQRELK